MITISITFAIIVIISAVQFCTSVAVLVVDVTNFLFDSSILVMGLAFIDILAACPMPDASLRQARGNEKGSSTAPVADGRKGTAAIPVPRWRLQSE